MIIIILIIIIITKTFLRKPVNYLASEPRKPTPDSPLFTDVNPNEFLRRKKTESKPFYDTAKVTERQGEALIL